MKKTAFVLSGGGGRGAYEIGVWKALQELGEVPQIVVGSSVGAINSAIIAQNSLDAAERLWKELETSHVFDVTLDESLPLPQKRRDAARAFGRAAVTEGGAGKSALDALLHEYINEDEVRRSPVQLGVVAVSVPNMRPAYVWIDDMPKGQLHDWLLASSSLFPAIKPQTINGTQYVDGGYADNMPVNMALQRGAERVIAVNLDALGVVRRNYKPGDCELIEIRSYWDLGEILLFDPASARNNIRLGYLDAMRTFHVYEGFAYAFVSGSLHSAANGHYRNFYDVMGRLGFSRVRSKFIDSLAYQAIRGRIDLRREKSSSRRGFVLEGMESAGQIFALDMQTLYSLERFHERLREAVDSTAIPEGLLDLSLIGKTSKLSSLLDVVSDKRVRTKFIAHVIFDILQQNGSFNFLPLAAMLTDEFSAALYIALLYRSDGGTL